MIGPFLSAVLLSAKAIVILEPADCVVLLHGLARSPRAMTELELTLIEDGYRVANVSYPSREYPIEQLAPMAVEEGLERCAGARRVHFVTHSLGGILVRYYYADHDAGRVGRVVMLAPPNQGSKVADALRDIAGFDWLNGPAGSQLGKGEDSLPKSLGTPAFEFAVIAGNRSIDPVSSAILDDPDDGKVSVDDTKLDGMSDFRVVEVSHAFIMKNDEVIALTRRFLRTGSFDESVDGS
jgi:pimeloyl-ACP methyl ester carboxylesterase